MTAKYDQAAYIGTVFAPSPTGFARFSLLFLYSRIFSVNRRFRTAVTIVIVINALWWIACTIPLIALCVPIEAVFNPLVKGTCINTDVYVLAAEIPDIMLDFAVMALPLREIRKLQMPLRQKIGVSIIIAMGAL